MSAELINLAKRRWFVPIVMFLLIVIMLTSFSDEENNNSTAPGIEEKLETVCMAVSGAQNATVIVTYESSMSSSFWQSETDADKKVSSVAVICDGGDNPDIQLKIHNIIRSLYDLSSTRITVTEAAEAVIY